MLNAVLQSNFTLFNQLQDGYSGKLLGDRANPENHARLHGYLQFKIGTSKCLLVNDVPLSCNQYGNAGLILFEGSVDQAVDDCTGLTGCVGLCVYPYCEKTGRKKNRLL